MIDLTTMTARKIAEAVRRRELSAVAVAQTALDRIAQGTFGRCEECRAEIPRARLQAVPYARHCVACARKLEHNP